MIFELTDDIVFPDPRMGEEDGLLAVGGDLSVDRLLLAYSYGIFPWFSFRDWPYPAWYCPMKRFVIFPSEVHISHSMRTLMNKHEYRVTFNQDFEGVIHGCSEVDGRYYCKGAWLGEDMMKAYTDLYLLGYAKSVEDTKALYRSSGSSYLEVLTAEQNLLNAQLSKVTDDFYKMQAVVSLYTALGGGGK